MALLIDKDLKLVTTDIVKPKTKLTEELKIYYINKIYNYV